MPADKPSSSSGPRSCFDRVLDARQAHLKGRRGSVSWDLAVPQFSGAASATVVNRHVRASAQDAIDRAVAESRHDGGAERTVGGKAQVSTSDRRTVQVELTWADYLAGTAHPSDYVATTVVTTDAGRPVLLGEVLGDEHSALVTLGRAVRSVAAKKGEDVTEPDGLAPRARNFANWQTTRSGMRFTFGDYQLGGHGLHMRAINQVRAAGSIAKAVEQGIVKDGIMYSLVKHGVPFVLTGSIRDDGPLPDVITDALAAQDAMRVHAIKATMAILIATALHAIATGNMLPAFVTEPDGSLRELSTICVDSLEFVVTKLKDRGTHQAFGVVTNAQDFMHILRLYVERELDQRRLAGATMGVGEHAS